MIEFSKYYFLFFGVLTVVGGIMGYVKAKSRASLIAGGISGALLIVAGALIGNRTMLGLILGLVVSVLLAGRFVPAFLKTRSPMPSGMMSGLSLVGLVVAIAALIALR